LCSNSPPLAEGRFKTALKVVKAAFKPAKNPLRLFSSNEDILNKCKKNDNKFSILFYKNK
jgi:hypothetical protein